MCIEETSFVSWPRVTGTPCRLVVGDSEGTCGCEVGVHGGRGCVCEDAPRRVAPGRRAVPLLPLDVHRSSEVVARADDGESDVDVVGGVGLKLVGSARPDGRVEGVVGVALMIREGGIHVAGRHRRVPATSVLDPVPVPDVRLRLVCRVAAEARYAVEADVLLNSCRVADARLDSVGSPGLVGPRTIVSGGLGLRWVFLQNESDPVGSAVQDQVISGLWLYEDCRHGGLTV
ncbi:MAG: hypothetical protein UY82_C0026G0002 [Candidatus Uhrbacteria bacterium GW2011_GWC2_53_7]|uniref:Uncharacterized protein n=1 Tax=Candidatus Uhrbacteria bacterium GW2011_GWC2_53_7 TaxID=1618986 RepID=A0A0G2A663_9BACT|nr:MAG: hypothetical protein UY82_C0026G0002 [Candidatus Uhrbacteria bacterium GW2011_GWC2_53_7]